ncbi:MAG TPA: amidase family protein, partial [Verrucomicrobiae bacterium]|nr:amidase family protein [Verrucomicrobiae bacterium]
QAWLATGSDLGGSLRTPASFCGVVGLRPSPGLVASGPSDFPFDTLSVKGPMARNVADAALMLDAMAGRVDEDPMSLEAPAESFLSAALAPRLPRRVAYSPDLGICRVAPAVREVTDAAMALLAGQGVDVVPATPDLSDAPEIFKTLRAAGFAAGLRQEYEEQRHQLKPEVVWNIEHGRSLTAEDIGRAERARGQLYHRMRGFMRDVDLLLVPAAILPPFDVQTRWIREWEGVVFENYVEWIRITYAITLSALPVLCIPCGLTPQGLPIGLQLVGKPRGEAGLLAAGAALEAVFGLATSLPIDPRPPSAA